MAIRLIHEHLSHSGFRTGGACHVTFRRWNLV
jgi:hypothetical protein